MHKQQGYRTNLDEATIRRRTQLELHRLNLVKAQQIFKDHLATRAKSFGTTLSSVNVNYGRIKKLRLAPGSRKPRVKLADLLEYYAPIYPCFGEQRLGRWSDGGKWICRPYLLNSSSVVYRLVALGSIGSHAEISFELAMYGKTRAEIHVFDHTLDPTLIMQLKQQNEFVFHDVGLGSMTDKKRKLMRLKDIMRNLGHKYVDVLKIDCEGCEYTVMKDILRTSLLQVGQIQVEVHNISNLTQLASFLSLMEKHNFRMFHMEPNWRWLEGLELAYIHVSLTRP
eukprot:SM000026S08892  [mRNA]  locus=s26:340298:341732:+ [translate_table: standard]